MKPSFPLTFIVLTFTGCSCYQPCQTVLVREVFTEAPRNRAPSDNLETVRHSAVFKAYPLRRYIDPNDPRVLHESHVVYVEEASPTWNLRPHQQTFVPHGPGVAASDPARVTALSSDELLLELNEQKKATKIFKEQAGKISQTLEQLSTVVPLARKAVEQSSQLDRQQRALEDRLKILEEEAHQSANRISTNNRTPASGPTDNAW